MTRYFQFLPNIQAPYTFQPVLDRRQYSASVTWNLYGQRWYLNLTQLNGTPVFTLPLIGSPDGVAIDSVSWSFDKVTAVTSRPHGYTIGQTVLLTLSGFLPAAYNGTVLVLIVDPVTFTYSLPGDPGDATQLGAEIYNNNLAGGYFSDSVFVFREASQTFEVTP